MSTSALKPLVLITAGGTREPIDGVRFLTNFSSGKTGATIAEACHQAGMNIIYLHAVDAERPVIPGAKFITFDSSQDLERHLHALLKDDSFTAVIHAAAVGDYRIDSIRIGDWSFKPLTDVKLPSEEPLTLSLKPGPKIIDGLRPLFKDPKTLLIGFKLTKNIPLAEREQAVSNLIKRASCDFVVSNDLSEVLETTHIAQIYGRSGRVFEAKTKLELGSALVRIVQGEAK